MKLTAAPDFNEIPAQDVEQLEKILIEQYQTSTIKSMRYRPVANEEVLLEYLVDVFGDDRRHQYFTIARKSGDHWALIDSSLILEYSSSGIIPMDNNTELAIQDYIHQNATE